MSEINFDDIMQVHTDTHTHRDDRPIHTYVPKIYTHILDVYFIKRNG